MTDLEHTQSAQYWPTFVGEQTIIGWKLLDFVDWVIASKHVLADPADPRGIPIIALPPMQRSAVWRPKQVLDLWNSLMRGSSKTSSTMISARTGGGNRVDQDEDISRKMPFAIVEGNLSEADGVEMARSAFPPEPEHRSRWKRASHHGAVKDRKWNDARLAAFQRAVEQRAAWLYRGFYGELGYAAWILEPR